MYIIVVGEIEKGLLENKKFKEIINNLPLKPNPTPEKKYWYTLRDAYIQQRKLELGKLCGNITQLFMENIDTCTKLYHTSRKELVVIN
jgi:regulator of replication initiation timing